MKYFFSIILIITIINAYLNHRVFRSLQDQVFLYVDFNNFQNDLKTPLEIVSKFQDNFPSINNVTIPIKVLKANYFFQNGDLETALKLIEEGRNYNPNLYISEYLLSKIYYEKGEYEKAAKYAKLSVDSLPNNYTHITNYQKVLSKLEDKEELDRIFLKSRKFEKEAIWYNHIFLTVAFKKEYSSSDSLIVKEAVKLFPSNRKIAEMEKIICYKSDKIILANKYDQSAINYFEKEEFSLAIEEWENAKKIIQNDEAYYLNIAKCYTKIKEYSKSLDELDRIEKLNISTNSGQLEFLKSINFFQEEKTILGCRFLNISASKGYKIALDNVNVLCQN